MKKINCYYSRRSNFSKDHCDKTEVPDPLVVEDLISVKLKYYFQNTKHEFWK